MNKYIQEDKLRFSANNGENAWTTVYLVNDTEDERQFIFCVFAEKEMIEKHFTELGWSDFFITFKPNFLFDKNDIPIYSRYGTEDKIKPLVIKRHYNNLYPPELEISEEFRLFFNIHVNGYREGTFQKIDEVGEEEPIIKFNKKEILVKTEFLKQYASAQKLEILIIFEYFKYFKESEKDSEINLQQLFSGTDEKLNFYIDFQESDYHEGYKFNSRLIGKKWVNGLKNYVPQSILDIIDKEYYEEFIVKIDEYGKPIYKSCNTTYKNPDIDAHYLIPVYFKREVLRKYYDTPDKYEVKDRLVHKIGGWYLRVDNNNKDYIIVFLGDLGSVLPSKEQTYWKHYNISNAGLMSRSYYESSIEGRYSKPELSEFVFKNNYDKLNSIWLMKFGFRLFKQLHNDDSFHLNTLRLPLNDSTNEFDSQILSLIKLTVDSINEKDICKYHEDLYEVLKNEMKVSTPSKTPKGLDKLQMHLEFTNYEATTNFVQLLRGIQEIRSYSVAHRKGDNYKNVIFPKISYDF